MQSRTAFLCDTFQDKTIQMSIYLKAVEIFSGGIQAVADKAGVHRNNVRRAINGDFESPRTEAAAKEFVAEKLQELKPLIEIENQNCSTKVAA